MVKWKIYKEGLGYKNLQEITTKYNPNYRKHRYVLADKPKKQVNGIFIEKKLAIKVIMDCRTTVSHKVRTRLELKQYNTISTKEQSVLTKIISSFEEENMQTQNSVLSYGIDLYFQYYKLAIKIYKNGLSDRIIDYEIKRHKAKEQELGCKCIRSDLDKEDFDIFRAINEIFRHIKQWTQKTLISKNSTRVLGLEFKWDNKTKSKATNLLLKKYCLIIINSGKVLCHF